MKKIVILLFLVCGAMSGHSQSIVELTEQLVVDGEELAAMKSTLQELIQGYDELKTGFTHIRDIVKDNFNLHKTFLDALWIPSPAVRNDPRMGTIVSTAARIVTSYRSGESIMAASPVFSPQESTYISGTLSALLGRCNQELEELAMVSADEELRMSDDQRLEVVGRIDTQMRAELGFLQQFNNTLAVTIAQRQKEAGDIHTLKILYGLP